MTAVKAIRAALLAGVTGFAALYTVPALAASSAVIIMYHRFEEPRYPSTNTPALQFEEHIQELQSGPYTVLPVSEITAAIRDGRPLPDRTVGITIDDGYLSIYTVAWPRLRAAGLPFTVFISTESVDRSLKSHMSWDQLREMAAAGVEIGAHSVTHPHMIEGSLDDARREIRESNARFQAELGKVPKLFAYPYGEAGLSHIEIARKAGYQAAFGQHSGVANPTYDIHFLPRFPFNEQFGAMSRFRLVVNALPLPVKEIVPREQVIGRDGPPILGFTVTEPIADLDRITCFFSKEGKVRTEQLGDTRIEVRPTSALPVGRSRANCTLPTRDGRWRWWGRAFYVQRR